MHLLSVISIQKYKTITYEGTSWQHDIFQVLSYQITELSNKMYNSSTFMPRDLLENADALYNMVLLYFLASLPDFCTAHFSVILPSGVARFVHAAAGGGKKSKLGESTCPDRS